MAEPTSSSTECGWPGPPDERLGVDCFRARFRAGASLPAERTHPPATDWRASEGSLSFRPLVCATLPVMSSLRQEGAVVEGAGLPLGGTGR